jgi:cell division protein FtsL
MSIPDPMVARPARPGDPSPDSARYRQRMGADPSLRPARPRLQVVPPHERRLRSRRVRRRLLACAGALAALATVFGLVLVHVDLTANQLRLTSLQDQAQKAETKNDALRLQVANLASPARIVARAQQLGMVTPQVVLYLGAVAGVTAATTPTTSAIAAPTASTGQAGSSAASLSGWAAVKHADTGP